MTQVTKGRVERGDGKTMPAIKFMLAALLMMLCPSAFARDYVAEGGVMVNADSVFYLNAPSAMSVYKYRDKFNILKQITIYNDAQGVMRVAEARAYFPSSGRTTMDTLMFTPEGNQFRKVEKTVLNGQTERYNEYEADERDLRWNHKNNLFLDSDELIGTCLDAHGNWTRLYRVRYRGQDPELVVERENTYELSSEEQQVLAHCNEVLQEIDSQLTGFVLVGLVLFLIGVALGALVLWAELMPYRLQALLGGWLAGPLAIAGFYVMFQNLFTLVGKIPCAVISVALILLMSRYFYVLIARMEDDLSLSNSQVSTPFVLAKCMLLFLGWLVGAGLWGTWWAAMLTVAVFALPVFAVTNRGERCPKCHYMGTIHQDEVIKCGARTEERHSGNYIISTTYERYCTRRKCSVCDYSYLTAEKDGKILAESRRELSRPVRTKPRETASSASRNEKSKPCMYLSTDMGRHVCRRIEREGHDCEHYYCQDSCWYYQPRG